MNTRHSSSSMMSSFLQTHDLCVSFRFVREVYSLKPKKLLSVTGKHYILVSANIPQILEDLEAKGMKGRKNVKGKKNKEREGKERHDIFPYGAPVSAAVWYSNSLPVCRTSCRTTIMIRARCCANQAGKEVSRGSENIIFSFILSHSPFFLPQPYELERKKNETLASTKICKAAIGNARGS